MARNRSVGDLLGHSRDDQGRTVAGDPTKGCWSCGAVSVKYSGDGTFVLYHPSVECCEGSLTRMIEGRDDEIAAQQHRLTEAADKLNELYDLRQNAQSVREEERLSNQIRKAEAGQHKLTGEVGRVIHSVADERKVLYDKLRSQQAASGTLPPVVTRPERT